MNEYCDCGELLDHDCMGAIFCPICDGPCPHCDDGGGPSIFDEDEEEEDNLEDSWDDCLEEEALYRVDKDGEFDDEDYNR
jgi:hypothetical protein